MGGLKQLCDFTLNACMKLQGLSKGHCDEYRLNPTEKQAAEEPLSDLLLDREDIKKQKPVSQVPQWTPIQICYKERTPRQRQDRVVFEVLWLPAERYRISIPKDPQST